jgi:hypothetical protein
VATIPPGGRFRAVTGETHTRAGLFRFTRDEESFRAGDRVWVYDYVGEGFYRVWSGDGMREARLLLSPGAPSRSSSVGELEIVPVQTWWVRVILPNGIAGWVIVPDPQAIAGADGCGR